MQDISIFAVAATSIVVEAAPFLLLGSLIGAIIEVLVSEETLLRFIPRNPAGQVAVGLFSGMLLPTCECGIVPVAKRLLLKNVPPRVAIPYMMAAPVVNPVVIGSTLFAFQGDVSVVALRILLVIVPAMALGIVLGDTTPRMVLKPQPIDLQQFGALEKKYQTEEAHGSACGCGCGVAEDNRLKAVLFHTGAEFMSMGRFLVFGAVVAAGFKTFLPPEVLTMFIGNGWLAVAGLMILAILLSICSEADAFVAASFASFPTSAQIAFMAVGPMVDLKLIPMFFAVFHKRVAIALIIVPIVSVYAMGVVLAMGGGNMAALMRFIEACLLVAMGSFMAVLSQSSLYWQFLNPKYSWLTCISGIILVIVGFGCLLNSQRRRKTSELVGIAIFLCLAGIAITFFDHSDIMGDSSFETDYPSAENQIIETPSITEGGQEYIKINVAELLQGELDGFVSAGQAYAVQGAVVRTPELDNAGYIAVARLFITCCFADSTAAVVLVKVDTPDSYTSGVWIRVLGIIKEDSPVTSKNINLSGVLTAVRSERLVLHANVVEERPVQGIPFLFEVRSKPPFAY